MSGQKLQAKIPEKRFRTPQAPRRHVRSSLQGTLQPTRRSLPGSCPVITQPARSLLLPRRKEMQVLGQQLQHGLAAWHCGLTLELTGGP